MVYCLVDVFVPSLAVTTNVDVVLEETPPALPEKVPLEFKVIPLGREPDVTEKEILSPSSSVAVTVVIPEEAPPLTRVPKVPAATPNAGAASILKASANSPDKLEDVFVTWTLKGSFALVKEFGTCAVICVALFLVTEPAAVSIPLDPINLTDTAERKLVPVMTMLDGKAELSKLVGFTELTPGGVSIATH